jgi:cell division transport system permease protein
VASVVRLALLARRDEIHIMQLVGAPLAYIRGPFVLEGLIQGGAGALVATVVLWLTFLIVRGRTTSMAAGVVDLSSLSFLSWPMWLLLMGGGMTVGSIGGFVAARSAREMAD